MRSRKQKQVTILDVGGYKGEIHRFFPENQAKITIIDLFDSNAANYIKGSALDMPFQNDSFDYVVSFEVFEHIPRESREIFIQECKRVSKNEVILTAPFSGVNNEVLDSEILVNKFWKTMHGDNHRWLYEHISYGTPSENELEDILKNQNLKYKKYGNNDLTLWNLMLSFNYITTLFRQSGLNPDIQRFYNTHESELDSHTNSFYRKIYVIGDSIPPLFDDAINAPDISKKENTVHELINKIFTVIAKDIKKRDKTQENELKKISLELEKRIHMYDHLMVDYLKLKEESSLSKRLKNKIGTIKEGKFHV